MQTILGEVHCRDSMCKENVSSPGASSCLQISCREGGSSKGSVGYGNETVQGGKRILQGPSATMEAEETKGSRYEEKNYPLVSSVMCKESKYPKESCCKYLT